MVDTKSADTEFVVDADPDTVWRILADVNNWYRWNVFPFRSRGPVRPGDRMYLGVRNGLVPIPLAFWEVAAPGRELSWGGGALGLRVQHGLWLEPLDDGTRTKVRHRESLDGWAARLIPDAVLPIWRWGLRNINAGLPRAVARAQGPEAEWSLHRPRFDLEPVEADSDFYENAPIILEGRAEFPVSVKGLWEVMDNVDIPPIRTQWITEPPYGPGSLRINWMRDRHLNTGHFTKFEPYREMRFYLGVMVIPLQRVGAIMSFEDLGPERSALTWRLAITARPLSRRTRPLPFVTAAYRPVFSTMMKIAIGRGVRRAIAQGRA
ncbi:SRPBCC family protein [Nocardia sp. CDC160]|uniref:SRPBCC family protein n=1 Tax=Nocardia sp. CDC160 TaxID=3112166 RepID=UPI002DBBDC5D|nr:SRPBCC family protein [Nocardia sp. CDC160]MEC3919383.1 SRPBCC family protein [Nocardia sp. CDC160]